MSQCVPNWDIDDDAPNPARPRLNFLTAATASAAAAAATTPSGLDLSSIDYEVAELTWENGQLSMHGLGHSRLNSKPTATVGTLESLVNQATSVGNNTITPAGCKPSFACGVELVPGFDLSQNPTDVVATTSDTMTMDLLVPCTVPIGTGDPRRQPVWLVGNSVGHGTGVYGCCSTHVGSCSTMCGENRLQNPGEEEQRQEGNRKRTRCVGIDWGDHHSVSGSATYSHPFTQDTFMHERELENATSPGSPENMSCGEGRGKAAATTEEHDSVYSRPQKRESEEKRRLGKSSLSTRRSRAAAIHNQSERKRRDKINQKMKTLQKLVPNSSKTDKASVLDEVIDYLKQLQAQVQMMSRMNVPVPPMMLPLTMLQQQLQLSMMAPMGLGLGMAGMPAGVRARDMSGLSGNRPNIPGIPPSPGVLHPFMPVAPWDSTPGDRFSAGPSFASVMPELLSAYLASQSSSPAMTLDAYSRLAAIYQQQIRQQQPSNPNN